MATNILPAKFDGDDIVAWLREFDACALANGWKDEDKIKKLPAFLRGRAATHFYTIPDEERSTYAAATKKLKEALCPPVERENNYVKFEARMLRVGEDPSIYKWELEQLLEKADPTLGDEVCLIVVPIHAWSAKHNTRKTVSAQLNTNLNRNAKLCSAL